MRLKNRRKHELKSFEYFETVWSVSFLSAYVPDAVLGTVGYDQLRVRRELDILSVYLFRIIPYQVHKVGLRKVCDFPLFNSNI